MNFRAFRRKPQGWRAFKRGRKLLRALEHMSDVANAGDAAAAAMRSVIAATAAAGTATGSSLSVVGSGLSGGAASPVWDRIEVLLRDIRDRLDRPNVNLSLSGQA